MSWGCQLFQSLNQQLIILALKSSIIVIRQHPSSNITQLSLVSSCVNLWIRPSHIHTAQSIWLHYGLTDNCYIRQDSHSLSKVLIILWSDDGSFWSPQRWWHFRITQFVTRAEWHVLGQCLWGFGFSIHILSHMCCVSAVGSPIWRLHDNWVPIFGYDSVWSWIECSGQLVVLFLLN